MTGQVDNIGGAASCLPRDGGSDPPLAGVRVLDLSRVLAGPLCAMMLGDLGADVLKVERPGTGDETRQWGPPWVEGPGARESAYYLCANRSKRSITADLSDPRDAERVAALAAGADVVVENFASGALERFGLGYDLLAARNPRLVLCSITGYGPGGRPGYDFALQAETGWMAVTGPAQGEPAKAGVAVVDVLTAQNAVIGILAALREREHSGCGQRVEVALYDAAVAGLVNIAQSALIGREPRRQGNAHPNIVPYQAFAAADRQIVVAVGNDAQWRRLCEVLELPELAADPRFSTNPGRVTHRDELVPRLVERLAGRSAALWIGELERAGVPCALVRSVTEGVRDPAFAARGGIWPMRGAGYGEVDTLASPVRLSRTPPRPAGPPPALGEHDAEVAERGWG